MFRLYFYDIKTDNVIKTIETSADTLTETELISTLECRRLYKNPMLHLEYNDDLVYDICFGDIVIGRLKIRTINETVSNSINKR